MTQSCPYAALYGPDYHADPNAVYEELRNTHGPVAPVEVEPGIPAWVVLDYATITAWCRDIQTFSHDSRNWRDWREGRIPDDARVLPLMMYRPNAIFVDGLEHERLRRAITDSMGKVDAQKLTTDIRHIANRLIDGFCTRGEAEVLDDYARLLPLLVINRLFGFSDESGYRLLAALTDMWDGKDAERSNAAYVHALSEAITAKHKNPGEDITSWLISHRAALSDEEVLAQLALIIGAGNEATANLISNAIRVLIADPAMRRELVSSRLSVEEAVDRVLWHSPPITNYPILYPRKDIELGNGMRVREGEPVLMGLAAANHFIIAEHQQQIAATSNRAHLAWGVGPHRCPSQDIARRIATTGIQTLLDRLPDLSLAIPAEDLTWRDSPFNRALTQLPVAFTPQPPAEEGTTWEPSTSSPPTTSTNRPRSSGNKARSSRWNFLARWLSGR